MGSEKTIGMKVKVQKRYSRPELRGLAGTVVRKWGAPAYAVFEVLLDDGRRKLFWEHELELADELSLVGGWWRPLPFYDDS